MSGLLAGAAAEDITPPDPQFLFGYPHVERTSTGVHDRLWSSALALCGGPETVLFIANDLIYVSKESVSRIRAEVSRAGGIPEAGILVSATHTHSGPKTLDHLSNEGDPAVPRADPRYMRFMEERIAKAGLAALRGLQPAEAGLAVADGRGMGTNRRDPNGLADPQVPVLLVRSRESRRPIACMLVCSMHPTVLHEDSTLVSADFPGMTRAYLQRLLGGGCVVVYHTGPEGDQSPRHITRANTFAEARRLGELLGRAVQEALPAVEYHCAPALRSRHAFVDLPRRAFPGVEEAEARLRAAAQRLEGLRRSGAGRQEVRTAECDWFGAEETCTLARAARDGRMERAYRSCLPAEIQVLALGPWRFVAWPGELFVEYALRVKARFPHAYLINLANGDLQGYIVTAEAAREGGYEASNGLFGPASGEILVGRTLEILERMGGQRERDRG
jgi:hypothetical protein